jgi:hypothetical protein
MILFAPLSFNDPFTVFLLVAAAVLMAGYAVGRWTNQRLSRRISAWLEPGLRSLRGTPSVQPVQRSIFRIQVTNARRPFQTVTASVVLISREVLLTWLWEKLRHRRDLLVVHVTFRQSPAQEVDIVDPINELGQRGLAQIKDLDWLAADVPPRLRLYRAPDTSPAGAQALAEAVAASPFGPWRVALRRAAPHLLLSMPLPDLDRIDSKKLADWLNELSKLIQFERGESVS